LSGNLILIPARAGSTRIEHKNIKPLGDKPLVGHVITAALACGAGRVVVSTNSREIAEIAQRFGTEVPFLRPDALSDARATSISALLHALKWLRDNEDFSPELTAFCPPTNPFTSAATIGDMFTSLARKTDFNSAVTITEPALHPFSLVRRDHGGRLDTAAIAIEGKHANNVERSQDMPGFWQRTAGCSITRTRFFADVFGADYEPGNSAHIHVFDCDNCFGHEIDGFEALDIDTMEDWERAEAALRTRAG
jgi:CMP-N-acetylneuraminic acid synthetase